MVEQEVGEGPRGLVVVADVVLQHGGRRRGLCSPGRGPLGLPTPRHTPPVGPADLREAHDAVRLGYVSEVGVENDAESVHVGVTSDLDETE